MNCSKKLLFWELLIIVCSITTNAVFGWDQNVNGMSDVWESRYSADGLSPDADEDNDQRSNLEEAIAGTNPFNPSIYNPTNRGVAPGTFSNFLQVDSQNNDGELIWWGVAGKLYTVQSSTDLRNWDDEITVFADKDSEYSYVTGFNAANFFLRVLVADTDSDNDSLSSYEEIHFGTSDSTIDSDLDSYPDAFEISYSENPTDPDSTPPTKYIVAPDGSGDFIDLKSAIEAIDADYQIIVMKPGNYTGDGNTGINLDETNYKILILGEQGPAATRIDGAGQYDCLYFANASALVGVSVVDCVGGTSLALVNDAQTANSLTRDFSSSELGKAKVVITWNP